jgi:hypothetical protein
MVEFEPDEFGLGEGSLAGGCEHGNELSGSIKTRTFFVTKIDYHWLLFSMELVQTMQPIIMMLFPFSCYFFCVGSNYQLKTLF